MTRLEAIKTICDKSDIGPRYKLAMINGILEDEPDDVSEKSLEAQFVTAEFFKNELDHFEKEMARA